jgi:hypothetical protein
MVKMNGKALDRVYRSQGWRRAVPVGRPSDGEMESMRVFIARASTLGDACSIGAAAVVV